MNIIPHLFIPLSIGVVIFIIAFFKWTKWAVAGLIIAKPIIDLAWDYSIIGDINFLKIYAGLFVILGILYIIQHRIKFWRHHILLLWLIFIGLNFISYFLISSAYPLLTKAKFILCISNGGITVLLFGILFDREKEGKMVILLFLAAAIVPMLFWLMPVLRGNPVLSSDELQRIIGPYRTMLHFKFYSLQLIIISFALLGIILNRSSKVEQEDRIVAHDQRHFLPEKIIKVLVLCLLIVLGLVVLYLCYSKAGLIIGLVCILIWSILHKKYLIMSLVPIFIIILSLVPPFRQKTEILFKKERDYFISENNTWDSDTLLMGRVGRWKRGYELFRSQNIVNQLFGAELRVEDPVNDYLRILWHNGIIGFVVYCALMVYSGYLVIRQYIKNAHFINSLAIIVFTLYVLDSVGTLALFTIHLQWFTWGIIGLSIGCWQNGVQRMQGAEITVKKI